MKQRLMILGFVLMNIFAANAIYSQNVFVWKHNSQGLSGSIWNSFLLEQGLNVTYDSSSVLPTDYSAYDAIFLHFGIDGLSPHPIDTFEAKDILNYANAGGKVYIEGGEIFGYNDGQTIVQQLCGLSGANDGGNISMPILGASGTVTDGMSFSNYTGGNSWIDYLYPASSTAIFFADDAGGGGEANECRGIQWDNGTYKVVGVSFELGGLDDGAYPSTKNELMTRIVDFLGIQLTYAPRGLTATAGLEQVTLKWSRPALTDGFQRYRIYYGTSSNPTVQMDSTAWQDIEDTTLVISLPPSITYYFRVTTLHNGIESEFSNEVSAKPFSAPVGIIVTNSADNGYGSLRWAIDSANTTPEKDTISFDVDLIGETIFLSDSLPSIREPVYLNGDITDDGVPDVELNYTESWKNTLTIRSANNVIRGLVISGNRGTTGSGIGLLITGTESHSNQIIGNYLGIRQNSSSPLTNGPGIVIDGGAFNNIIGDGTMKGRNVFTSTYGANLRLNNAHGTIITGNYFGVNPSGAAVYQDADYNISMENSSYTQIGGDLSGQGNYVCGAYGTGIFMNASHHNIILGNTVGLTPNGSVHGNGNDGGYGIQIANSSLANQIGNGTAGGRNIIAGNSNGIIVESSSDSTLIIGNFIGTNAAVTSSIGNNIGIVLEGAQNTQIGDGTFMGRNIISGNSSSGISLRFTQKVIIVHNYIGVDSAGVIPVSSQYNGIEFGDGVDSALVGYSLPIGRNVISGNGGDGIYFSNSDGAIRNIRILNNFIGTDATGTFPVPNQNNGILAFGFGLDVRIDSIAYNTIAFNNGRGIYFAGSLVDSVLIFANSIYQNGGEGIYFHDGAQGGINTPTILSVVSDTVYGSGGSFTGFIQVYTDSDNEGQFFHGITGSDMNGFWRFTLPAGMPANTNITALNTFAGGRTSQFSDPLLINPDSLLVTKTDDNNSVGTLRFAISHADTNPGADTVRFSLPRGSVIQFQMNGVSIYNDSLCIDGDMDDDGIPDIVVTLANSQMSNTSAFQVNGSHNTIKGLVINGVNGPYGIGAGIWIAGSNNKIISNYIGTNFNGTAAVPNQYGIYIPSGTGSRSNMIGDGTIKGRNVISGNDWGIRFQQSNKNTFAGNIFGLNAAGTDAIEGQSVGIWLWECDSNMIGNGTAGGRNILSGHYEAGIRMNHSHYNTIIGNIVGLDITGTIPIQNSEGIQIGASGSYNIIGDATAGGRNIISGNISNISFEGFETKKKSVSKGIAEGTREIGNEIHHNSITGNFIGTDLSGQTVIGGSSFETGILFQIEQYQSGNTVRHNRIGGTTLDSGNVIAGCRDGIVFYNTDSNFVSNNFIGTNESLSANLGNSRHGIVLTGYEFNPKSKIESEMGGSTYNYFENNVVAFSSANGLLAEGWTTMNNVFSVNRFYENGLPIMITGGAQNDVASPIIEGMDSGNLLYGTASSGATVFIYADSSSNPQGRMYLDSVTANGTGGTWEIIVPFLPGWHYRALQEYYGNTSEFSDAFKPFFPVLTAIPDTLHFGDVYAGTDSILKITLKATNDPVEIDNLYFEGDTSFTLIDTLIFPININPGDSATYHVQFRPMADGMFSGTAYISNNTTVDPLEVQLTGTGIPGTLVAEPFEVVFNPVLVGDSAEITISIKPLNGAVTITGYQAYTEPAFIYDLPMETVTLYPGDSLLIPIKFKPTASGTFTDTIELLNNSAENPFVISLSGTGFNAGLTASANILDFGSLQTWHTSEQTVTIKPVGGTVIIDLMTMYGTGSPFSGMFPVFPDTLYLGDSLNISILFEPTSAGDFYDTLRIINDSEINPLIITMSGTAYNTGLTANTGALAFGNVQVTQSSEMTVTVKPVNGTVIIDSATFDAGLPFSGAFPVFPDTLQLGDSLNIPILFEPTTSGEFFDTLRLFNNSENNPLVISMSGTGFNTGLTANMNSLPFGSVKVSQSSEMTVTVKPVGGTVIMNSAMFAAGLPFSGTFPAFPDTLQLGDSLNIPILFEPTTAGEFFDTLRIFNNSEINPLVITMSGTGYVDGMLTATPEAFDFGDVVVGESSDQTVVVKANVAPVIIHALVYSGDPEFSFLDAISIPDTLAAGDSLLIRMRFSPASANTFSASITLNHNGTDSVLVLPLSGTGIPNTGQLAFSGANSHDFGTVRLGDSLFTSVTVIASDGPVLISQIVQGIGGAVDYSLINTPSMPLTIAAGDSAALNVRFRPVSGGLKQDTLKIYSNALNSSELLFYLSGTGQPNNIPNAFALKSVGTNNLTNDRTPDFAWEGKGDPDGDALTYILEVSKASDFATIAYRDTTGDTTQTAETTLDSLGTYFWRVTAHDGWGGSRTSSAGSFRIDAVPAVLTAGTFFSGVVKPYISVNVIASKLMRTINASIGLRNTANTSVDSTTKVFDLESAANRFYQTPYKLTSAGRLFLTITGTDSAMNTTTVSKNYNISTIAKDQTLAMNGDHDNWQITAPKRTFDDDGFLMVNELNHETKTVHGQSVMAMAKISDQWITVGEGLNMQGSAPIRTGQGVVVTMKYHADRISELQSRYNDYDERKIGLYAENNGTWIYTGGEGRNGQVQAKVKQYGMLKLMYNPDHEFLPVKVELAQNYPNPFNPTTTIRFGIPQEGKVKLTVYNVLGQKVKELVNDSRNAGYYNVIWNGRSDRGTVVSSGVYLYRLETSHGVVAKKMVLVK